MDCVGLLFKTIGIITISSDFCGKKVCSSLFRNTLLEPNIEPNRWKRFKDQLGGFSIIRVLTKRCFQREYNKVGFRLGKCVFGG